MGKGKGSFDHWASRIAVSKVIFEVKGDIHEQVVRDAFRLAGNKMPGEFRNVLFTDHNTYISHRYVRIRKEGRPPGGWDHKIGRRCHHGRFEKAEKAGRCDTDRIIDQLYTKYNTNLRFSRSMKLAYV